MERDKGPRNPLLFLLALPSVLFVVVHSLNASGILRVPYNAVHARIDAVLGGQPGASVVLVSALAAFAIAMDRVITVHNGRFSLRNRVSDHTAHVLPLLLLALWLFARLYIREYAWLYTTGGSGFFEAALTLAIVIAVLKTRRMPGHRQAEG